MSYANKTLRIGPHWNWPPGECKAKGPTVLDIISNQVDEITVLGRPGSFFPQFSHVCSVHSIPKHRLCRDGR